MTEIAIILLPVLAGVILFIPTDRFRLFKGLMALITAAFTLWMSILIFSGDKGLSPLSLSDIFPSLNAFPEGSLTAIENFCTLNIDNLSRLILVLISVFAILVLAYSLIYDKKTRIRNFHAWFMITVGSASGAVLADNLLLFLFFWGLLGITLYKLIYGSNEQSSAAAKKTLILIGASDSIMIVGIALLWKISGSLSMAGMNITETGPLPAAAFLALLAGSFTKAGAFPFHTWVPDYSANAPASSTAFLPAALDKLLGIYFLARITAGMFELFEWMKLLLLITGSVTIIFAVMMALVQHDYKRLLGYHAVSQVGYMILGFGLGTATGVAAGLFHMVNNAVYKSGLFLTAGAVEYRTGKTMIEDLGGLSKAMPLTFFASLIFALSISGIPPFNGFASKWMIYQGIIDSGKDPGIAGSLWIIWLAMAVLGSALTLASFIKFIGGIFLGRITREARNIREVPALMWIPSLILAIVCILFGVFATKTVVPYLFMPVSGEFTFSGFWDSTFVSLLVLVSFILGGIIYLSLNLKKFRHEDSFIGGERIQDQAGYPAHEFYKTAMEFRSLAWIYRKAEEKWFDIYDLSKRFVLWLSHLLSEAHSGVLPAYVLWVFAGLIIMLLIMI